MSKKAYKLKKSKALTKQRKNLDDATTKEALTKINHNTRNSRSYSKK